MPVSCPVLTRMPWIFLGEVLGSVSTGPFPVSVATGRLASVLPSDLPPLSDDECSTAGLAGFSMIDVAPDDMVWAAERIRFLDANCRLQQVGWMEDKEKDLPELAQIEGSKVNEAPGPLACNRMPDRRYQMLDL